MKISSLNIIPNLCANLKSRNDKRIKKTNNQDISAVSTETPINLPPELLRQRICEQRIAMLKPVKSEKVYERLFTNIIKYLIYKLNSPDKNLSINYGNAVSMFGVQKVNVEDLEYINLDGYEDVDFNLKGLVPYCGYSDMSRQINCWLTARKDSNPCLLNDNQMADIIRAFEFSLKQLDKKYGTINGTVYRAGYFNPITDKQYYSASDYLSCAIEHVFRKEPSKETPYAIIRIKNGHDIYDFQKDTATEISSAYAMREREILIDRRSVFKKIPKEEYTTQDKDNIRNIVYQTIDCDMEDLDRERKREIYGNISVWEEI